MITGEEQEVRLVALSTDFWTTFSVFFHYTRFAPKQQRKAAVEFISTLQLVFYRLYLITYVAELRFTIRTYLKLDTQ